VLRKQRVEVRIASMVRYGLRGRGRGLGIELSDTRRKNLLFPFLEAWN
jgi:hypothetical protein